MQEKLMGLLEKYLKTFVVPLLNGNDHRDTTAFTTLLQKRP
ncbi:hypothetical protein EV198_1505 [Roseivirga ehrenbergii]|nr:hypothetical protein EV198_1505 [Roseivirga ehrenbergii]